MSANRRFDYVLQHMFVEYDKKILVKISGTTTAKTITFGSAGSAPYSKTYVVDNAGSYDVTFKAYGQTGVTVAAGEKCTVYYNGTDIVKVASSVADGVTTISFGSTGLTPSTATSGAVSVAGTLAIANGGTGQTSQTAAFDALAPTTTQGDVIYFNGTDNVRLGIGTAGQALVVNTGATAPEWGTAGITTGKSIAMAMIFGF